MRTHSRCLQDFPGWGWALTSKVGRKPIFGHFPRKLKTDRGEVHH